LKLIDLIDNLNHLRDDQMIFIASHEPIREETEAMTVFIKDNIENGAAPIGMEYFLEAPLAKEVLHVWEKWRNGKKPTLREKFQALVYYAVHDAYMPEE
jgi:hypothetical protein